MIPVRCILIGIVLFVLGVNSHNHHLHQERVEDGFQSPENERRRDHEAILGSKNLADEYEELPPEEAKRRLKGLAKKMDTNKDGFVDKEELRVWILNSFESISKEQTEEKLEDDDANKDGKVSWQEHLMETFGDGSTEIIHDKYTDRLIEEDQEQFNLADANKDGLLDAAEFNKFSNPHEYPEFHPLLVKQTLTVRDLNKDGKISLKEYLLDEEGNELSKENMLVERERFEHDLDKNKDGVLDEAEVRAWIIPDNDQIVRLEGEHLMENCDVDRDGKLSIQEIVDHHEIFVGSEATDYGEHLIKFKDEL